MSRGRRWLVSALVGVLVAAAAAGIAWSRLDDGPYTHTLVRFDDDRGEANRYTNLEDGAAQLSIGSPDGHRLVVQWRDPDGHGWTAPETVWTDRANVAIENTLRYGSGTVGIVETYTPDTSEDDDSRDVHVGIVCRDLVCTASDRPGFGSEPQVTPDGKVVYLGQDEHGISLWTEEDGLHRLPWSGHPGFDSHRTWLSGPALAPDGSLRLVASRASRTTCSFQLLASAPRTADLTPVTRLTQARRDSADPGCQSSVHTTSSSWLEVSLLDDPGRSFWFLRRGDGWTTTRRDPSGLEAVAASTGCCGTSINAYVHWNSVAYGSPDDGRHLRVQTRLLGEESWGEPQVLDGAPRGYRCTWMEGSEVDDGFVVLTTCHRAGHPVGDEFTGDSYAVAATTDLEHWETAWVAEVKGQPELGESGLRVGDLTWTAAGGFETH